MPRTAGFCRLAAFALSSLVVAAIAAAQPYHYTVTNVSATAFQPAASGQQYFISGSAGRFIPANQQQLFWTSLLLPPGAVVDYIGINNLNDGTPLVVGAALYGRFDDGNLYFLAGTSNTPHTAWQTDINPSPFGIVLNFPDAAAYLLRLEFDATDNPQYIGAVQGMVADRGGPDNQRAGFQRRPGHRSWISVHPGARGLWHYGRLRRRQLLPRQSGDAPTDGDLSLEGARLELHRRNRRGSASIC